MIFFVQEFDRKPHLSHSQILEMYAEMAKAWQVGWPSNRLMGFFSHRYYLGCGTQYQVVWQLPDFAALDEWQENLDEDRVLMLHLEDAFRNSIINYRTSVYERLL